MENTKTETTNKQNSSQQRSGKEIEKIAYSAGENLGHFASDIAETTKEYAKKSQEYVKHNPGVSMAVAATAGLIAGSLITMALHKRK